MRPRILLVLVLVAAPSGAPALATTSAAPAEDGGGSGGPCPGIHPGLPIGLNGAGLTAGFVFRDAAERLYMVTNSFGDPGDPVFAAGGDVIGDVRFRRLEFAWDDFVLFEIRADKVAQVRPAVCTWGGPTGTYVGGQPPLLTRLRFHADLVVTSPAPGLTACAFPEETCVGYSVPCLIDNLNNPFGADPRCFGMYAAATPYANGAPVTMADGRAMGMIMGVSAYDGSYVGVRVPRIIELVRAGLGIEIALVTVP